MTIKLNDWDNYLESRVGIDVYVYGGNGETIITLMPKLTSMEKSLNDVDRVLTLLSKRLLQEISVYEIRGEDCSGLAVRKLLEDKIIKHDMTANGLWDYIVGTDTTPPHGKRIPLNEVRNGDYLFQGNDKNKHHVGYAVSDKYAIESQNHDVGVTKTIISERGWNYAARPDWYEAEKYVLTRTLYLTDPCMRGDDVKHVQERLSELGYNCGKADGVFGKKTEIASKNFKHDAGLKSETGTVGKKTAEALGFEWGG